MEDIIQKIVLEEVDDDEDEEEAVQESDLPDFDNNFAPPPPPPPGAIQFSATPTPDFWKVEQETTKLPKQPCMHDRPFLEMLS